MTELDGQVENLHLDLCCLAGNQEDLSKDSLGPTKSSKIEGAGTSISEPPSPVSPYASESCGTLPLPLRPCGEGSEMVGKENSSQRIKTGCWPWQPNGRLRIHLHEVRHPRHPIPGDRAERHRQARSPSLPAP